MATRHFHALYAYSADKCAHTSRAITAPYFAVTVAAIIIICRRHAFIAAAFPIILQHIRHADLHTLMILFIFIFAILANSFSLPLFAQNIE